MALKNILISFLVFFSFTAAQAENRPTTGNPLQFISGLGDLAFSSAGGVFLPLSVVSGLKQGHISPIMQFVLVQHTINSCTKNVISKTPDIRDPYVVSLATFKWGVCFMTSCFKNILILQMIPLLSSGYGNENDQKQAKIQGLFLANSFKSQPGCGAQGDPGIDPALIQAFQ